MGGRGGEALTRSCDSWLRCLWFTNVLTCAFALVHTRLLTLACFSSFLIQSSTQACAHPLTIQLLKGLLCCTMQLFR